MSSYVETTLPLMPLWCRLNRHRWTVWGEVKERQAKGLFIFTERYQVSGCAKCGAVRERVVPKEWKL